MKPGSLKDRARGTVRGILNQRGARQLRSTKSHFRSLRLEPLETRALLTYTYPYGAMPDDTGEYMLGDVEVNVVLMESDPTMAPYDNNAPNDPVHPGHGFPVENWNASPGATGSDSIAVIQQNITAGLQWWKDTMAHMFPKAPSDILNFHINWQYAIDDDGSGPDGPVHTGYEPIARISNDFAGDSLSQTGGKGWIYDFLHQVGFDQTGNFSTDIRAFNDYTRQHFGTDWATTIFVVNNANDSDKLFADGGSFRQAFSFAGGRFEVVPSSRPVKTFSHETGHQFWALDEYIGGGTYTSQRGYYDTQNLNAADNPDFIGANEVQSIAPYQGSVTGGTFSLTIDLANGAAATTGPIAYNATASAIQAAINTAAHNHIANWIDNDIAVSGGPLTSTPITLTFSGSSVRFAKHPLAVINAAGLTGGGAAGLITETKAGAPPKAQQADSVMSNDPQMQNSFDNHTLDPYTMAAVGWQDSDNNGIFDVLDVPFSLSGFGRYNGATGKYEFRGSSNVNALPNQNSSGTGDDIQIDQIRVAEVSLDDGISWQSAGSFADRTYTTPVSLDIGLSPGIHDIWIRTRDDRTGVTSNIFKGEADVPTQDDGVGVGGVVFLDQNGNGSLDDGEKLEPNQGLIVKDENDQPVDFSHFVDPDDYASGTIIDHPPEEPNATLSVIGGGAGNSDVVARSGSPAPNAQKVFTSTDILLHPQYTWSDSDGTMLRVDFDSSVSTVSLQAYGTSSTFPSYGRLDAYTAGGQLVARFSTGGLTAGDSANMSVSRPQGDIAYVIAYGHNGSEVVLDSLHWGPATTATTNSNGAYSLDYLPSGTYHVYLDVPVGYHLSTPATPYASISVAGGLSGGSVNFGIAPDAGSSYPFHKSDSPNDVNNDGFIAPNDALMIINYLNSHQGEGEINPAQNPTSVGYIDVVADNVCAPNDALTVINWINAHQGGGEAPSGGGGVGGGNSGGGSGEGETTVPASAADYYAQNLVHFENIADAVPDTEGSLPATGPAQPQSASDIQARSASVIQARSASVIQARSASEGFGSQTLLPDLTASSSQIHLIPLSASNLLLKSDPQAHAGATSWVPISWAPRKTASDPLDHIASKLEKTLDEIAADVSQADLSGDIAAGS